MEHLGVCPLRTTYKSMPSKMARLFLGFATALVVTAETQGQQYYYPSTTAGYSQPQYYVVQPTMTYGGSWGYYYTPQYYQAAYSSQNYQYYYPVQYPQTLDAFQTYQISYPPQPYQEAQATPESAASDGGQVMQTAFTASTEPVASQATPAAPAGGSEGGPVESTGATAQATQAPAAQGGGDPYGFMAWLNATRASYGLGPVGHDPNLSNWAAMNNAQQQAYGLGHFVMGPARRQNSAMGGGFPGAMWLASPAHAAALLDPTITWFGIAAAGAYWTFNAF
jgi:hypothetical protein